MPNRNRLGRTVEKINNKPLLSEPISPLIRQAYLQFSSATGGVTVGSISGGAFNPAVVFGSAIRESTRGRLFGFFYWLTY